MMMFLTMLFLDVLQMHVLSFHLLMLLVDAIYRVVFPHLWLSRCIEDVSPPT